jgi:hypothetical protein
MKKITRGYLKYGDGWAPDYLDFVEWDEEGGSALGSDGLIYQAGATEKEMDGLVESEPMPADGWLFYVDDDGYTYNYAEDGHPKPGDDDYEKYEKLMSMFN